MYEPIGPDPDVVDLVELVGQRGEVLALLVDRPASRSAVQAELGVSRSTAYRALRDLEENDLAERTPEGHRATLFGALLLDLYGYVDRNVSTLSAKRDVFSSYTAEAELDLDLVLDGEIYTRADVDQPGLRMVELARTCDRFLAMAGVHRPELLDPLHERICAGEIEAEIVMTADILDYLRTYAPEKVVDVLESGNLALYRLDDAFPWGMTMTETDGRREVAVAVHDDLNPVRAVVVNDGPRAVARFEAIFEAHRVRSEPVTEPLP